MIKHFYKVFCCFIFFCVTINCYSWWSLGHEIVANIAYQQLTPKAKIKVDNLLKEFIKVTPGVTSFEQMAVWADTLYWKQKIYLTFGWHFIDNPYRADNVSSRFYTHSNNAVWAVNNILRSFTDNQASTYEQARMLAFLAHIVGDLHQPLHNVSRISVTHPEGDKGGNDFQIIFNGNRVKLHEVWDNAFGEFDCEDSLTTVKKMSTAISTSYPPSYFGSRINALAPEVWSKEGFENAVKVVYKTKENGIPDTRYLAESKELIKAEIALAGYRLANILNNLFNK